jgi:hypothetical protein
LVEIQGQGQTDIIIGHVGQTYGSCNNPVQKEESCEGSALFKVLIEICFKSYFTYTSSFDSGNGNGKL